LLSQLFRWLDFPVFHWLYDRTIAAPTLATAWFCFPIPPLVVWCLYREIPQELLDSIRLEGGSRLRQFWRLGFLDFWPQWLGIGLLTFCCCFGELSAAQLVIPPGVDTIPRLMLGLLHSGVDEMTAGLTLILIGGLLSLTLVGWGMFVWLFPRSQEK
jgi:ABC-type spermidine/putrescine transport system permease subunit II